MKKTKGSAVDLKLEESRTYPGHAAVWFSKSVGSDVFDHIKDQAIAMLFGYADSPEFDD